MTAITIEDLDNAKIDVDHIAEIANSTSQTATDRMGHNKLTVTGAMQRLVTINFRGAWAAATAYNLKDAFSFDGIVYVAVVEHTSTTVAADLAAGKIGLYQGIATSTTDRFEEIADFTPGLTTTLTLSRDPGSKDNITVHFGASYQGPNQYSLTGTSLVFGGAIPLGTQEVFVTIGALQSSVTPSPNSVGAEEIDWDTILARHIDNVSALRALDKNSYRYAVLAGYNESGDDGGGPFRQRLGDVTSAENGVTLFVANDGARWERQYAPHYFSVRYAGAAGDGSEAAAAFAMAAQAAPAAVEMQGAMANGIARAPVAHVHVPSGQYLISTLVDTGGRDVQWHFDSGAVVNGYSNLPGRIIRDHQRIGERHYGSSDYATSLCIRAGDVDYERGAEIMGATDPSNLGVYPDRDSVSVFVDNTAPPPDVDVGNATYTSATIVPTVPLTADQVKKLRVGMMIDTKHAPTKYTGFITGWAANGTSITVSGWFLSPGPGTPAVPANGTGAYVNPITKIWAHNANVQMPPTALANRMVGFELGLLSGKPAAVDPYDGTLATWGFDAVNLGSARSGALFIARGDAWHGYRSENQVIGYAYKGANAVMEARSLSGDVFFTIAQGGSMEVGLASSANTPSIDFHSSGSAVNDYDSRIVSTGGTGAVNGQANLLLQAAFVETGTVRPDGDNTRSCGESGKRWSVVYAATGAINTSDAREKTPVRKMTDAEISAAKEMASEIGAYRWLSSVAEKGSAAREHIGMTVQRAIEIMQMHGLDPMAYGFICYDQWGVEDDVFIDHPQKDAVIDKASGKVLEAARSAKREIVRKGRNAGDLYSFRVDQLTLFIARGMEARISAIEAAISKGN